MPRPKSKNELIELCNKNFKKLLDYINALTPFDLDKEFKPGTMNRNIRDVLAHLHQWHLMMLDWYAVGMSGVKPDMPAKGYSWKTTSELNRKIWSDCQNTALIKVRKELDHSFDLVQEIIQKHSDGELFEKRRYPWTGSTSLGAYLISATSSHYDWALKLIKRGQV